MNSRLLTFAALLLSLLIASQTLQAAEHVHLEENACEFCSSFNTDDAACDTGAASTPPAVHQAIGISDHAAVATASYRHGARAPPHTFC